MNLQEKAIYFAFLLLTDNKACSHFTAAEVSAASLYMAIKMLEKKAQGQIKLISRTIFEQILYLNGSCSESKVISCSTRAFYLIQKAINVF